MRRDGDDACETLCAWGLGVSGLGVHAELTA